MKNVNENNQKSEMRSLSADDLDEVSGGGLGGWIRDRTEDVVDAGKTAGSWTKDRAVDGKNLVREGYRHLERDAYRNNNIHC